MRISCNGCRVLRKGCGEDCTIRPCLSWIRSEKSQMNATLFLAKFYGRAGLLNLINGGPEHLKPAIFRSLLYEACGRLINPIYGSVGLLWSGKWQLCQEAVEGVLRGEMLSKIPADIRHSFKGLGGKRVFKKRGFKKKGELRNPRTEVKMMGGSEGELELELTLGCEGLQHGGSRSCNSI